MGVNYFTLFDLGYAGRGLTMLDSIERFRRAEDSVTVLALDDATGAFLRDQSKGRWRVLGLGDLGDKELLEVKETRPFREFCWTTTPALSAYMVGKGAVGDVAAYVDADMMFFNDPRLVLNELGEDGTILIHEHRYSPDRLGWLKTSGRFNVGLVGFRVGEEARVCADTWRQQTIQRCELDPENGHCGDQGYLDDWPALYPNLKIMQHIGGGVAPWNVVQYDVKQNGRGPEVDGAPVVFYHYHSLKTVVTRRLGLLAAQPAYGYEFGAPVHKFLYRPYLRGLRRSIGALQGAGIAVRNEMPLSPREIQEDLDAGKIVEASWLARAVGEYERVPRVSKEFVRSLIPPIIWQAAHTAKVALASPAPATAPTSVSTSVSGEVRHDQTQLATGEAVLTPAAAPEWEMVENTDAAWTKHEGWSHSSIASLQKEKWPSFLASVAGSRALGLSHEAKPDAPIDDTIHNMIMTFGYALGRAASGKTELSLLDWGGGVGHYAVYARALFPHLKIRYTVSDLAPLCAVGRELLPDVEFIEDPEQALAKTYDLVFASSAIQYSRDVYGVIAKLCAAARNYLMVTRSPFLSTADDFVVVQRPYVHGYMSEYAAWFLNRDRFKRFVEQQGLALQREFLMAERPFVPNAIEQCRYEGFLFERPVQT